MELLEGVGNEVLFFGLGSAVFSFLLYHVVQSLFRSIDAEQTQAEAPVRTGRTRTATVDCCICLGETQLGLETICGHVYCGNCILEVTFHLITPFKKMFHKKSFKIGVGRWWWWYC